MSGTLNSIYNNVSYALYLHTEALARLQEQVSTGSRINRASDDPSAAYHVLGFNSQQKSLENYIDNISEVVSTLEFFSTTIESMTSSLVDAKVRLTQLMGGIYGEEGRERAAEGINSILEHLVSLVNTKYMNQYIFGGSNTTSASYLAQRTNGEITSVTYIGSSTDRDIEVAPGVQSSAFQVGDDIFSLNNRSEPQFLLDSTGAQAGTRTSSVTGYTWLTVTQDTDPDKYRLSINDGADYVTVLKGKGSEVQTLTFSAVPTSGSFTLTFNGQKTGAIQWNEGAAEVEAALEALPDINAGDVTVTGSYAAGFTITFADTLGNVSQLAAGDNTLDGGTTTITEATTTEGIGDTNLAVTDSAGRVLYVNTTGITNTGVDLVSIPGTHDIFNTLITVRDILKNEKGLSESQLAELLNDLSDTLDDIHNLVIQRQAVVGSEIEFLDDLTDSLKNRKYNAEDEATRLQEADIAQIAIDLARREVLYQMSLSVAAKLMSMSLLDFIS
jgi:flagellar hook-associated protein 3